jgi:hypothetical protein
VAAARFRSVFLACERAIGHQPGPILFFLASAPALTLLSGLHCFAAANGAFCSSWGFLSATGSKPAFLPVSGASALQFLPPIFSAMVLAHWISSAAQQQLSLVRPGIFLSPCLVPRFPSESVFFFRYRFLLDVSSVRMSYHLWIDFPAWSVARSTLLRPFLLGVLRFCRLLFRFLAHEQVCRPDLLVARSFSFAQGLVPMSHLGLAASACLRPGSAAPSAR